jgi:hypothetical protein
MSEQSSEASRDYTTIALEARMKEPVQMVEQVGGMRMT